MEFPVYCAILLIFDARDFNTDIIYPEDVLGIPNLDLSKRFFMEKSKISASNVYSCLYVAFYIRQQFLK